jgi:hypothetical protein
LIEPVVHAAVAESYLIHINIPNKADCLRLVGELKLIILNAGTEFSERPGEDFTPEQVTERAGLLTRARYIMQILDITVFELAELNCDPSVFMEILMNNVRNDVCSFQAFYLKERKKNFNEGLQLLKELKIDYVLNSDRIRELEKDLNRIVDAELRAELENYDVFEHLVAEKINPKFLQLANSSVQVVEQKIICNDNLEIFESVNAQKDYITNYFANIYRNVPGTVRPYEGCIEDFLGPDIVGNQHVSSKKVPENMKQNFESNLTSEELDEALRTMRNKSAGGPDGFSVKFIKRFWSFFRIPLTNYSSYCVQNGTLTDNFKCASIKIIPKKGDLRLIKNWRPISLLNVMYKIIAKALNNRLKKAAPCIISRSQKGFIEKKIHPGMFD